MLLADALQDAAGTPYDVTELGGAFTWMAREVAKAKRIDLEPLFARVAADMGYGLPSLVAKGLPFCRLPWPSMWIEMPFREIGELRRSVPKATPEHGCRLNDDLPSPDRFGMLLRAVPGKPWAGEMTFAWQHRIDGLSPEMQAMMLDVAGRDGGAGCEIGRLGMFYDFQHDAQVTAPEIMVMQGEDPERPRWSLKKITDRGEIIAHMRTRGGWGDEVAAMPAEVDAVTRMNDLVAYAIPRPLIGWFNKANSTPQGRAHLEEMQPRWEADISGEAVFVIAVLWTLNAPGMSELAPIGDLDRLNAARAKLGKRPLLSHVQARIRTRHKYIRARADA